MLVINEIGFRVTYFRKIFIYETILDRETQSHSRLQVYVLDIFARSNF